MRDNSILPANIPKYISSFDLEEARLGQAIQSLKLEARDMPQETYLKTLDDPELLILALRKIRNESINAEWALDCIAEEYIDDAKPDSAIRRKVISNLMNTLLKKKLLKPK